MRTFRYSTALLGLAVTGLLVAAPSFVTIEDAFTDSSVNTTLWKEKHYGTLTVAEVNQRLEFSAPAGHGDSYAGLEVRNWGADWRRDFEVAIDYKFTVGSVTGSREVLIGIGMVLAGKYPESMTGYEASIARESTGLYLWLARYNNGHFVEGDSVPITATQGTLFVEWYRDEDRLSADVMGAGGGVVHQYGVWSRFGATKGTKPMVIGVGCSTYAGNRAISANRAQADNFYFWGVQRPR